MCPERAAINAFLLYFDDRCIQACLYLHLVEMHRYASCILSECHVLFMQVCCTAANCTGAWVLGACTTRVAYVEQNVIEHLGQMYYV